MIVLLIIGVIFCFLFCLSLIPIYLEISFDGKVHAVIRFLFLHFDLTDKEENVEKIEHTTEEVKDDLQKPSTLHKLKAFFKREGILGLLSLLSDLVNILMQSAKKILFHARVKRFHLNICVASVDAHETALLYGKTCTVVASAYSLLFEHKKCNDKSAAVTCSYDTHESTGSFSAIISIRLLFLLKEAIRLLFRSLPLLRRFNGRENSTSSAPSSTPS